MFSDEPPAFNVEHRSVASSELHCCHKAQVVDVVFLPSRMIKTKAYKYICSSPFNWIFRLDNLSLVSLEWARATKEEARMSDSIMRWCPGHLELSQALGFSTDSG